MSEPPRIVHTDHGVIEVARLLRIVEETPRRIRVEYTDEAGVLRSACLRNPSRSPEVLPLLYVACSESN